MALLNHLKHPHPLVLSEEKFHEKYTCQVCSDNVYGQCYCCNECTFFVHEWCAALPLELTNHRLHPDHPLVFLSNEERCRITNCDDCKRENGSFVFSCEECDFDLHPCCALLPNRPEYEFNNMELLNHLKHPHPLVLSEEKFDEKYTCQVCSRNVYGPCYCCNDCTFFVHECCARLPPAMINHFLHPDHPLVILSDKESCITDIGPFVFSCKECNFDLHPWCALLPNRPEYEFNNMELLNHLKHPHPLVLSEEKYSTDYQCMVCSANVIGLCYCCNECTFVVHKWCADLPFKLTNHRLHPLVLLSYEERGEEEYKCKRCYMEICLSYAFGCKECSYFLHPWCALLPKQLEFEYNDEDSLPTRETLVFNWLPSGHYCCCGVCKQKIGNYFYRNIENYTNHYHFECVTLPKTVKHEKHIHDFTLHAPIEKEKTFYVNNVCNLCEKERDPEQWLYYCEKCDFPGHLSCGLLGSPVPNKGILTSNLVYSAEVEKTSLAQKKEMEYLSVLETRAKRTEENLEPVGELVHFSHEHPLLLIVDIWDEENNCSVCDMPVHGLVYSCHECKFYLHKWCAELPQQVHFGLHFEHPLTLMQTDELGCSYCRIHIDASYYCCLECGYGVHTTCAFLPKSGLHSCHDHPLEIICVFPEESDETWLGKFPLKSGLRIPCNACQFPCYFWSLGCTDCDFYLHVSCYLYPTTRKAETHRHNLNLTYAYEEPFPEFMCDTCEKPRTANCWVYCCPDPKCSIVAHLDCGEPILFPTSSYNEMIKHQEDSNECRCATCDKERDPNDWVYCCPSLLLHLPLGLERPTLDQPIQRILKNDPAYGFLKENITGNLPKPEELQHFSHEHLLVLCDEKWNGEICCEVCSRSIYGKTYICNECGYYLHKWCAQIPQGMHFRCHSEHPLTLLRAHDFECSVCKANNFGFSFSCERCDFEADPLCILKPDSKLESHKHPTDIMIYMPENSNRVNTGIYPVKKGKMPLCNACRFPCEGMTIEGMYGFCLHVGCAWYPHTCETEAHIHSLTLHDDSPDHTKLCDRYLCDVCDKRLTKKAWGYICLDEKCNLTAAHLDCAIPNPFLTSSFKPILMHQELL